MRPDLAKALLEGYCSVTPALAPKKRAALPHLLPVVHVDYALSEVEYFHAVARSPANAVLAYRDYLLGHLEWFAGPDGRRCARTSSRCSATPPGATAYQTLGGLQAGQAPLHGLARRHAAQLPPRSRDG